MPKNRLISGIRFLTDAVGCAHLVFAGSSVDDEDVSRIVTAKARLRRFQVVEVSLLGCPFRTVAASRRSTGAQAVDLVHVPWQISGEEDFLGILADDDG